MIACQRPGCTGHYADRRLLRRVRPQGAGRRPCRPQARAVRELVAVRPGQLGADRRSSVVRRVGRPSGPSGTGTTRQPRLQPARPARRQPRRGAAGAAARSDHARCWPTRRYPSRTGSAASAASRSGRGKDGKPGRAEGFCPRDRTPFSFVPSLKPGDLVDDRYEILGCLAHGGLGWIYLGRDRNISDAGSDRWVVLKGLINTGDADAMAAAVAERRFLVEVDHPNIVKIHDFAEHPDPKTGENVGYIVMEYVGGRSLKDIALNHRGPSGGRTPLPLPQVLAYGLEVLPALGYLHDRGLLFCDFKPDNVIHAEEQLKLIDLGAVRRIDDQDSALYGTPGYQAPELATDGPSISSDLYTVGRTLAVLSFDFTGFTSRYADKLPDPADVPLLAAEESYYRLLRRATHPQPDASVRLRRRHGRPAGRRAARGAVRGRRRAPAGDLRRSSPASGAPSASDGSADHRPRASRSRCRSRWSIRPTPARRCSPRSARPTRRPP